jgi:hypothetical protein
MYTCAKVGKDLCCRISLLAVASNANVLARVSVGLHVRVLCGAGFAKTLDYVLGTKEERNSSMMYIDPEVVGLPKTANGGKMMLVEVHGCVMSPHT